MTDPLTQIPLVQHIESFAGECSGAEPPTVNGPNRGYAIAFYGDGQFATAVSNGVRFQGLTAVLAQEIVCSVLPEQAEAGRYLVDLVSGTLISAGRGLEYDTVMRWDAPILAGTAICALLASTHPNFDDGFDLIRAADGELVMQLVTMVPITAPEAAFVDEHGAEALFERWQIADTPLEDVTRDSAV